MKSWIRSLSIIVVSVLVSQTVLNVAQAARGASRSDSSYTRNSGSAATSSTGARRNEQTRQTALILQQTVLTLINQARAQGRRCGRVTYPAAPLLVWNRQLEAAAQSHSTDMASHNFFSHSGSDGLAVASRVATRRYRWQAVGENIAAGTPTAEATVNLWLQSPEHCANIMNPVFSEIGAAMSDNPASDYTTYWTLVLADR
jgi:uncharacterized protein YkwD